MKSKIISNGDYIKIDDMVFPNPVSEKNYDLEWRARFSSDILSNTDILYVASVMSAYRELIQMSQRKRNSICSEIRNTVKSQSG